MAKNIKMIVLTGGPCAGKTTVLSHVVDKLKEQGVTALVVPETATELMSNGINPALMEAFDFQNLAMKRQIESEKLFRDFAEKMDTDKVVIFCDRGCTDFKVYMDNKTWQEILKANNITEEWARDHYDGVIKLDAVAKEPIKGKEAYEQFRGNNEVRKETANEAIALDNAVERAWVGTSHLVIIPTADKIEEKEDNTLKAINDMLGLPIPKEIERKFLINMPNLSRLSENPNCTKTEILQTYIKSPIGTETRVRQRGSNGHYTYYETRKTDFENGIRSEEERIISKDEYLRDLMDSDPLKSPVRKDRYCILNGKQYVEVDVYDGITDRAVMEVECDSLMDEVHVPEGISIIREITGNKAYSNGQLAKSMDILKQSKQGREVPDLVIYNDNNVEDEFDE